MQMPCLQMMKLIVSSTGLQFLFHALFDQIEFNNKLLKMQIYSKFTHNFIQSKRFGTNHVVFRLFCYYCVTVLTFAIVQQLLTKQLLCVFFVTHATKVLWLSER